MTRGATPGLHGTRPSRRATRRWTTGVAAAATLLLSLLLALTSLTSCEGPCQRHSDCPSPWVCSAYGVCEPEATLHEPPPDAADNRIPGLADGAIDDDSDLAEPPADADLPDAAL